MVESSKAEETKRKASISYTIKSLSDNVKKLDEAEMLTTEERDKINEIRDLVLARYIKKTFN